MPVKAHSFSNMSLLLAIAFGFLVSFFIALFNYQAPLNEEAMRSTLVATGRASFLIFFIPLIAKPLYSFANNALSRGLLHIRPLCGMAFFGSTLFHLSFVYRLYQTVENPEPLSVLLGGLTAAAYLSLMTAFTFPIAVSWLGMRKTRLIHQLAFYMFLMVFGYDLIYRNLDDPSPIFWTLYFGALLLRIAAWAKVGKKHPHPEPLEPT
ncbi:hypothetical protein [Pseudoteredinibacter isoporae]|uniref:Ferric oxidoreductase domain-containing protein n=1 Tax=Pseudoteredinibacter isoporae TaxID=570281 RepID=A0A7X0MXA2_9GAMM|nr:hypothetical protein [Pseudoteredinibacter isoporae]MBB6521839.1 hypothetical protein [Pseudoteredinibacter isoporae]NHO87383.1 hypothetical protein [Pseudoteredinibacter isoporae]NIB23207.1 hypothetical protein [Pseudoteredinibacter isoporae]